MKPEIFIEWGNGSGEKPHQLKKKSQYILIFTKNSLLRYISSFQLKDYEYILANRNVLSVIESCILFCFILRVLTEAASHLLPLLCEWILPCCLNKGNHSVVYGHHSWGVMLRSFTIQWVEATSNRLCLRRLT